MTIPLVRFAIAELLRPEPMPVEKVARLVSLQIIRNEQARHDRWSAKGLLAPPKRVVV